MTRSYSFITLLLKTIIGIVLLMSVGKATTVEVSPATKNVLPGSTFTVSVVINNVTELHSASIQFTFDNTIIRSTIVSQGLFLLSGGETAFFGRNPAPGPSVSSILVDQAILGAEPGFVSGTGTIISVTFVAVQSGTSSIALSLVDLRGGLDFITSIPATAVSGSVTVGNPNLVYVNQTYTSGSAGGHDFGFDAFNVLTNGVSAANVGGTVNIAAATYNESVNIAKNLTLMGSGNPTIQNLTVNTPAVTIGGNIQISNVLTLTSGVVTTGLNTITITNDQPGGVVITNGAIDGEICRTLAAGNTGEYQFTNQFTKITPAGAQPTSTVCVIAHPNTYPPGAPAGTAINRYYTITAAPLNFTAAAFTLEFLPSENINSIPALNMEIFRREGVNPWESVGRTSSGPPNYYVSTGPISSWSDWTIGDATNPLPIQLVSFAGNVVNNVDVKLDWRTLSEINNYGFEVQKSNGTIFSTLANSFIAGHGTTNEPQIYSFTDINAGQGNWFYRLKQIDLDGTPHFSAPVIVDVLTDVGENSVPIQFKLEANYPNPFNPSTTVSFALPKTTHVTLEVFNMLGEKIARILSEQMNAGRHSIEWNANGVASGVYLLRLTSAEFVASQKMLLSK